ncbi:MFS transporter [Kutzneria sp. CA-103260]|uniref:MFS transporter n=1 Tax=Kutzneria sp. CA-103260 TaxID=2802641 RepID=UPI001BAD024A|nr:MFS transporter [Kutzneria sp. CA-103260]QUQ67019.1 major facilitator superfamily transporter [Kutzneria sp. CA-103260]
MEHVLARRHADFRRLFIGNSVSLLGSSVTAVALPLSAVVYLHASPFQMGLLGVATLAPHFVFGLPAGVWVDRLPYRRILVAADIAQTILVGAVPLLAWLGVLSLWHLYVIVVLAGVANLFENVTAQSFTPHLVPREQLLSANSTLMASNATVNTTGSAVGSALVTVFAAPFALVVDAVSFAVAAFFKARISTPGPPPRATERRLAAEIAVGLRAVFTQPTVRVVIVAAALGALAGQMQNVVLVLFLVQGLKLSSGLVGLAITVVGVAGVASAVVATPITRRLGPGPAFIAGMLISALAGLVLVLASGPLPVVLAVVGLAQVLRGAGPSLFGVNQQTLRQTLVPPDLLSRVNATWRFLVYGLQPVGALLGGVLGSLDLRLTLIVSSVVMLLGVAVAVFSPLRSMRAIA